MPHESSQDLQGVQARLVASDKQNTHGSAVQASAARLISLLRMIYPEVKTRFITEDTVSSASKKENLEITEPEKEQQQLIADLTAVIANVENYKNQDTAALRIISEIAQSTRYAEVDKKNVFEKMCAIAKTHPGFSNWNETHAHWSVNRTYNAALKKYDEVIASPAEALNLVFNAIADDTRFLASADSNAKKDFKNRVTSLFNALLRMYIQEKKGHYVICAAGRQHELLYLLNHVFLDKCHSDPTAEPVILLEDALSFILSSLTKFIEVELKKLPESEQSRLISEWILYYSNSMSQDVSPIENTLRKIYPVAVSATSAAGGNPDAKWKAACKTFLEKQLESFCLNAEEYHLEDYLDQISALQPPFIETPIKAAILKAGKFHAASEVSPFNELVTARNAALSHLQEKIQACSDTHEALWAFYRADELFRSVCRYQTLMDDIEDAESQQVLSNLILDLTSAFREKVYLNNLDVAALAYGEQCKKMREHACADLIEHFFINGNRFESNLAAVSRFNASSAAAASAGDTVFLLTDERLDRFLVKNQSGYTGTREAPSYDINRILVHAFLTPPPAWSEKFRQVLAMMTAWFGDEKNAVTIFQNNNIHIVVRLLHIIHKTTVDDEDITRLWSMFREIFFDIRAVMSDEYRAAFLSVVRLSILCDKKIFSESMLRECKEMQSARSRALAFDLLYDADLLTEDNYYLLVNDEKGTKESVQAFVDLNRLHFFTLDRWKCIRNHKALCDAMKVAECLHQAGILTEENFNRLFEDHADHGLIYTRIDTLKEYSLLTMVGVLQKYNLLTTARFNDVINDEKIRHFSGLFQYLGEINLLTERNYSIVVNCKDILLARGDFFVLLVRINIADKLVSFVDQTIQKAGQRSLFEKNSDIQPSDYFSICFALPFLVAAAEPFLLNHIKQQVSLMSSIAWFYAAGSHKILPFSGVLTPHVFFLCIFMVLSYFLIPFTLPNILGFFVSPTAFLRPELQLPAIATGIFASVVGASAGNRFSSRFFQLSDHSVEKGNRSPQPL